MANLTETATYDAGVYQLETTDPVQGGASGKSNAPLINLANRTKYLKQHIDAIEAGSFTIPGYALLDSPAFINTPTAPTQALSNRSTRIATTAFAHGILDGIQTKDVSGNSNVTLTADEASSGILDLYGALTGAISVIVPATAKSWIVRNRTTGSYALTLKTSSGSGLVLAQGKNREMWCDGTNVVASTDDFATLLTSTPLTGTPTAPTAAAGTNTTQVATTAFVTNAAQLQAGNYGADTGTANALAVTLSPAPASYAALVGAPIRLFKTAAANTGAVTLNVNGLGAQSVVWPNGTALVAGDLPASCGLEIMAAGSYFVLLSVPQRPVLPADTTQSLGASGWTKLPNGLILQWGSLAVGSSGSTWTYPRSFPTGVFAVFGQPSASGPTNDDVLWVGTPGTSSCVFDFAATRSWGVYAQAIGY